MDSTNTCKPLCPLQCAKMYPEVLTGTSAAILDYNESPINAPHYSESAAKRANPPHTGDSKRCQYHDKTPLKPYTSLSGGGGPGRGLL